MSRIGKQPITIPQGVNVTLDKRVVTVKGDKGELNFRHHRKINVKVEGDTVLVERSSDDKFDRGLHGLTRTLIDNMILGVTKGFEKKLEIQGVGYRADVQGSKLNLSLGFSHPVVFQAPEGITISIDKDKKNILTISGADKQLVGEVTAKIRSYRKPEPYKGKGIRYLGEQVTRKAGKSVTGGGAPGASGDK